MLGVTAEPVSYFNHEKEESILKIIVGRIWYGLLIYLQEMYHNFPPLFWKIFIS